jgi:uncharacterized protein
VLTRIAVLTLLAGSAIAAPPETAAPPAPESFGAGSHERFVARVTSAQSTEYATVLGAYDAHLAEHPGDFTAHIERCRFIETFAYSEDGYIESSSDDLEACRKSLVEGPHAREVPVQLYELEQSWDERAVTRGQSLLEESESWPVAQRVTLLELLTARLLHSDPERAARYAMQAVSLDPGSSVLMTAVDRWVQLGAKDKALRLLRNAPASTWEKVPRFSAAQVLIELGEPLAAAELIRAVDAAGQSGSNLTLARALAAAGQHQAARRIYREVTSSTGYVGLDTVVEYFRFELDHGSAEDAAAAYQSVRDKGFWADPLGRQRLSLMLAAPGAAWQWGDALGLLTFTALLLVFCLVPLIVVMPVHYRGLARRITNRPPDLADPPWKLRHAAYALAIFLVADLLGVYVFAPAYAEAWLPGHEQLTTQVTSDLTLAKYVMLGSTLMLLAMLPLLRARSWREILPGRWTVPKCVLVGTGFAIVLKIVEYAWQLSWQPGAAIHPAALGSDTARAIQGLNEHFGLALALAFIAGVVPVVEELVFRGVLLQSFRGHVSFWFAASMQAAAFTLMHEEWLAMPFLMVFALVAAWLVRRSGGLLAGMVMHAVNNAYAVLMLVGVTNALNR